MQRAGLSQGGGRKQLNACAASLQTPRAPAPCWGDSAWVRGSSVGAWCLCWLQGKALLTNPVLDLWPKILWGSMQSCGLTAGSSLSARPRT